MSLDAIVKLRVSSDTKRWWQSHADYCGVPLSELVRIAVNKIIYEHYDNVEHRENVRRRQWVISDD